MEPELSASMVPPASPRAIDQLTPQSQSHQTDISLDRRVGQCAGSNAWNRPGSARSNRGSGGAEDAQYGHAETRRARRTVWHSAPTITASPRLRVSKGR